MPIKKSAKKSQTLTMERPSRGTAYYVDKGTARLLRLVAKAATGGDSKKAWDEFLAALRRPHRRRGCRGDSKKAWDELLDTTRSRCEPSADGYVLISVPALIGTLKYAPPEAAAVAGRMWDVARACMRLSGEIANALGVIHRRWKKDHDRRVARNRRRRAKGKAG